MSGPVLAGIPLSHLSPTHIMNGLVLAGGQSRRMGQPKSLLDYHGKPQYLHLAEMLSGYCERVFVSCRFEQQSLFKGVETILDTNSYGDIGPLNGVLSAFQLSESSKLSESSRSAWFVVGCDYPFLEKSDLEQLLRVRNPKCVATVFVNPDTQFPEPLIGIYEVAAGPLLQEWLQMGNESLRRFLEKQDTQKVAPQNRACLKSVDTREEMGMLVKRGFGDLGI